MEKSTNEGDDAGDEEQQQAETVEGGDFPVDVVAVRTVAAFAVNHRAAAGEAEKGRAQSKDRGQGNFGDTLHF